MPPHPVPNPVNPAVFPSETNARYLLLLVAIAGTVFILAEGVIGGLLFTEDDLPAFIAALVVMAMVFWRARHLARHDAQRRIRDRQWQPFPPPATGEKGRSLQAMNQYLQALLVQLPTVNAAQPEFVWDEVSPGCDRPTGIAFGYGRHTYVCLRQGLHEAFLKARRSPLFNAILLHELGHIDNQDVDKTILALALGKSFFPTALLLLGLLNLYVVWHTLRNMLTQGSLEPVLQGLPTIVGINLKTFGLLLLVDILLSSVLRVREYYADARARAWLGQPSAFLQLFATESAQPSMPIANQRPAWQRPLARWYERLTRKHPTHKQRIAALLDPATLYRPSGEVALLSGLLCGLVLNSGVQFLNVGLVELTALTSTLNQFAQGLVSSSLGLWLLRLVWLVLNLLFVVVVVAIVGLVLGLGVLPVVATVGLQIQGASWCDRIRPKAQALTRASQLARLALLLGLGFVLGCLLVPVPKTFSLVGVGPLGLGGMVLLWAVTFGLWLLPLAGLSRPLYGNHGGSHGPRPQRRFLTRLSALALLPSMVTSSIAHVGFSVSAYDPDVIPVEGLGVVLVSLMGLGFL
ncbi:M48 family metalloprotease, partial [Nodosilinea sp. LEGE 07088]|uniref:M48 family metalloprotease n=1 Tax=Nodosilinea sp. LEGE 07088 TaxID=2777968 RepID=UPI00188034B6